MNSKKTNLSVMITDLTPAFSERIWAVDLTEDVLIVETENSMHERNIYTFQSNGHILRNNVFVTMASLKDLVDPVKRVIVRFLTAMMNNEVPETDHPELDYIKTHEGWFSCRANAFRFGTVLEAAGIEVEH